MTERIPLAGPPQCCVCTQWQHSPKWDEGQIQWVCGYDHKTRKPSDLCQRFDRLVFEVEPPPRQSTGWAKVRQTVAYLTWRS